MNNMKGKAVTLKAIKAENLKIRQEGRKMAGTTLTNF
jgi:hypothetical protein